MADATECEAEVQLLLPADLRSEWVVVPKVELYWVFVVGAIFGAGVALSICGIAFGHEGLRWGFPAAFVLSWAGSKVMSMGYERRVRMLRGRVHPDPLSYRTPPPSPPSRGWRRL
jgi:hypothetical protein